MKSYSVEYEMYGTVFKLIDAENEEELRQKLNEMSPYDFEVKTIEIIRATEEIEMFLEY